MGYIGMGNMVCDSDMAIGIHEINSIQLMGMWDIYMGNGKSWDNWDNEI